MLLKPASWVLASLALVPAAASGQPAAPAAASPAAPISPAVAAAPLGVEASVVKVFATRRAPQPLRPWAKGEPEEVSGSGVVIAGRRILTNAHVVLDAAEIQIQANQSGDKLPVTVLAVAPDMDLALLQVDDPTFYAAHPPLPAAEVLPHIRDAVTVYGFPLGGTGLSTTRGIVSRIEFVPYRYPASGLQIQIDAALNPGNSGGPAVVDGRMVGLAYQKLGGKAQEIGYLIPEEEIRLFLSAAARGPYRGKPALYDECESLENPALRDYLRLPVSAHGTVVRKPFRTDAAYPLKEWDVITRIGDTPVDDEGDVSIGEELHVRFTYLVQKLDADGTVPLTVIRQGRTRSLRVPVQADRPRLLPFLDGRYPSYFIYGPLVFSAATDNLLGMLGSFRNGLLTTALTEEGNPMVTRRSEAPAFPGEQLVVVPSPFFPSELSRGYPSPVLKVVDTVDGVRVRNLAHLVRLLRDGKGEFVTIKFAGAAAEAVVLPRAAGLAATDQVLADNGIRSQGSPDMMAVWGRP